MTLARRVAAIETALTPTELVLRWLDEAHAHGDLESLARAELVDPASEGPMDHLAREAIAGARASVRGKGPEIASAAIRSAMRETLFRLELVMRIVVTTHELLEREGLIEAALSAQLALVTRNDRTGRRRDPTYLTRFATLRDLLLVRVAELRAAQQARVAVEARYLAGHTALFPDEAKAWEHRVESMQTLVGLAVRLAELDGVPDPEPADPDAASGRVTELIDDLVEPAKTTALEKLGEGRLALRIGTAWLRKKMGASEVTEGTPEQAG